MARARADEVIDLTPTTIPSPQTTSPPTVAPAAEPKLKKVCGTCKHWRPRGLQPIFGECAESQKSGGWPVVTTDLASCSAHGFK